MSFESELYSRFEKEKHNEYLGVNKPVNSVVPVVSVSVATYQHKDYIRQCIDGILMQKTDFPIEIIIGDDGSVDGTTEICKEYAEKHQDIIRLFIRDRKASHYYENGKFVGRYNGIWCRMSCRGKYIAMCEGDDYWTDPLKLQKQMDFLEKNEDCNLLVTNGEYFYEEKNLIKDFNIPKYYINNRSIVDLKYIFYKTGVVFITASYMFPKKIMDSVLQEINSKSLFGDRALQLRAIYDGNICVLEDKTAVYRVIFKGNSWTSSMYKKYDPSALKKKQEMNSFLRNLYGERMDKYISLADSVNYRTEINRAGFQLNKFQRLKLFIKYFSIMTFRDRFEVFARIILK